MPFIVQSKIKKFNAPNAAIFTKTVPFFWLIIAKNNAEKSREKDVMIETQSNILQDNSSRKRSILSAIYAPMSVIAGQWFAAILKPFIGPKNCNKFNAIAVWITTKTVPFCWLTNVESNAESKTSDLISDFSHRDPISKNVIAQFRGESIDHYACGLCDFKGQHKVVKDHVKKTHFAQRITCELCGRSYKNKIELRRHILRNRCKPMNFYWNTTFLPKVWLWWIWSPWSSSCQGRAGLPATFVPLSQIGLIQSSDIWSSAICPTSKRFSAHNAYKLFHTKNIWGNIRLSFIVLIFQGKKQDQVPEILKSPTTGKFRCGMCQYETHQKGTVNRHFRLKHLPNTQIECTSCYKVYKNDLYFNRHVCQTNKLYRAWHVFHGEIRKQTVASSVF